MRRVAARGLPLLQTSLGAALAYLLAREVLGHATPLFAPIAAIIAIGVTVGQPPRRAVEMVLGVAFGIGVTDALVQVIGSGPLQVGGLALLAMTAATFVGGMPMFVTQAGISAVIVAIIPATSSQVGRLLDTLVGGGVALVLTLLVFPVRPLRLVERASLPVLEELAATLRDVAAALRAGDQDAAAAAILRARATNEGWGRFREAVDIGQETARLAPVRWRDGARIEEYASAATQLDLAVRNVRVLSRSALRVVELGEQPDPRLALAVDELAGAVAVLQQQLAGDPDAHERLHELTASASVNATLAFEATLSIGVSGVATQVRSTAVDLLRAGGDSRSDAVNELRTSINEAPAHDEDDRQPPHGTSD
jgi:uncharacterized membrane protein YgaE (UPF0421/DUF939 family)